MCVGGGVREVGNRREGERFGEKQTRRSFGEKQSRKPEEERERKGGGRGADGQLRRATGRLNRKSNSEIKQRIPPTKEEKGRALWSRSGLGPGRPGEAERLFDVGVALRHGVGEGGASPAVAGVRLAAAGDDVADEGEVPAGGGEVERRAAVVGGGVDGRARRCYGLRFRGVTNVDHQVSIIGVALELTEQTPRPYLERGEVASSCKAAEFALEIDFTGLWKQRSTVSQQTSHIFVSIQNCIYQRNIAPSVPCIGIRQIFD